MFEIGITSARPSRREFMAWAGAIALWPSLKSISHGAVVRNLAFPNNPFTLGVASGDPTPDGCVLWTRLAPEPLTGGGMPNETIEVKWEVAEDEGFKKIVQSSQAAAAPEWAHSVHAEVTGLKPDRWYFYRFHAGNVTSPVGRTKTAPDFGARLQKLKFAFASCQHYESGLFTAYSHMAQENLDLVVHLGDYIYEGAGTEKKVRKHVGPLLMELADYRNRHAQYKTDEHLQRAHQLFPWIVTPDDHEVANNYAGDIPEKEVPVEEFLKRRAEAYKAYYEHMPLRKTSLPVGPNMQLYRNVRYGQLAQFAVLDTRQYRTDQPCGDGNKPPCPESFSESGTAVGAEQEKWITASLTESKAKWNILAQQIMMGRVDRTKGPEKAYSMDQWPGYQASLTRLMKFFGSKADLNPVVLTGDIHKNWVNDLKIDFDKPEEATVGTEFVGTSITSGGNGSEQKDQFEWLKVENPFVKFFNGERGYVRCEVTDAEYRADYRVVDEIEKPGGQVATRASFVVAAGRPGAEPV